METAKDLFSGIVFEKTRNNQKFSSRENQIAFNNLIAQKKRIAKAFVEKTLDKNRTIFKGLLANEKELTKSRDFLLGAGLNLNYSTHRIERDKVIYSCVYEYAYTKIDNLNYKIIKC